MADEIPADVEYDLGRFGIVPLRLLRTPGISDRAIRLYAHLGAEWAGRATSECWPSLTTLGEALGCSRTSVQRALSELKKAGALSVERRKDPDGASATNLYRLHTRSSVGTPRSTGAIPPGSTAATQNQNQLEPESSSTPNEGVVGVADRLCRNWWESLDPRPLTPFIGARKIVERAVKAGYSEEQIASALFRLGRSISIPQLQRELERRSPPRPENPNPAASRSWMEN